MSVSFLVIEAIVIMFVYRALVAKRLEFTLSMKYPSASVVRI